MTISKLILIAILSLLVPGCTQGAQPLTHKPYADLTAEDTFTFESTPSHYIFCPIYDALRLSPKPKHKSGDISAMKYEIQNQIHVIKWLKDGHPIYRRNGNYHIDSKDDKALILIGTSREDEGRYTCLLDYSNVTAELKQTFIPIGSISFNLIVRDSDHLNPPIKPAITDGPINLLVTRGSDVTFNCKSLETLSTRAIFWFKGCPPINATCKDQLTRAYNKTVQLEESQYLKQFFLEGERSDQLILKNVSDKDVTNYGCIVENTKGFDIKMGSLHLTNSEIQPPSDPDGVLYLGDHRIITVADRELNQVRVDASRQDIGSVIIYRDAFWVIFALTSLIVTTILISTVKIFLKNSKQKGKKHDQTNLIPAPIIGHEVGLRRHLPSEDYPDIYNISKSDGFIKGHLRDEGHHMANQSICSRILDKKKNPSISSSNSNSDEASSMGKSSHGDNSRAFYLHTSNTTSTTVPMYDHPPSTGIANLRDSISAQDACIINPIYGFLRPDNDTINWAFPRRNLEKLNKIGEGQFGEVWRYIARQKDGTGNVVAVKKLKNRVGLGRQERLELIAEIEIMKLINNHPNVIKLLNYCVDEFEDILLIMEYAEQGKLQTYLRDCRSLRRSYGFPCDPNSVITSKELIKFSYHVAKGMEYVASQGIIHRDLASRNILITKDKVCKVGDFGFARKVTDECAYERSTANPVPVKWMAPEALVENKFTSKSDVFSLGILMWEIVTLGATPYEYMTSQEVYKKVTTGGRLERPAHCKDEFYSIMAKCWLHDPIERPTFKELAMDLEKLLLSENDYIVLDQYPEHAYYNILNIPEKDIVNLTLNP